MNARSEGDLREQLFTRFHAALVKFFARRIRVKAHAEDLAQDTLLRVLKAPRTFIGGLVSPPSLSRGLKYPVVIQTYGFRADEFPVDGPNGVTAAYAARAVAANGIFVLQAPSLDGQRTRSEQNYDINGENSRFVIGLESAIDALDATGFIDRDRIGLIGWSREGMHVYHALTFSKYRIAAATVSDALSPSPFCHASVYGFPYPGMLEFEDERLMGGPFWGAEDELVERPLIHLSSRKNAYSD